MSVEAVRDQPATSAPERSGTKVRLPVDAPVTKGARRRVWQRMRAPLGLLHDAVAVIVFQAKAACFFGQTIPAEGTRRLPSNRYSRNGRPHGIVCSTFVVQDDGIHALVIELEESSRLQVRQAASGVQMPRL